MGNPTHVIVHNNVCVRRISTENIAWTPTRYCSVVTLTVDEKIAFGVFPYATSEKPEYAAATQNCVDAGTLLIDGVWTQQWAIRSSSTAEIRARGIKAADTNLLNVLSSGFTFNSILWHCDSTFQSQIQGFVLAFLTGVLPANASVSIRDKSNTNHSLNKVQTITLAAALMQHIQAAYSASWLTKDALPK